jgi:hypothetical protein
MLADNRKICAGNIMHTGYAYEILPRAEGKTWQNEIHLFAMKPDVRPKPVVNFPDS